MTTQTTDQTTPPALGSNWTLRKNGTYEGPGVEDERVVSKVDRDRWRREFDMERAKTGRLEHDLQHLRGLVDAVLDSEGDDHYAAIGALRADRRLRNVWSHTGEQERYFARVQAAIEDFQAGWMTCEQLRSYLRRVSAYTRGPGRA